LAIKNKDLVLHHPPYLADMATCDFWEGSEIWDKSMTIPHVIPQSQLYNYLQGWQKYWTLCINSEGDYSEGESNDQ
jgi:hypothetical protein